VAHGRDAVAEIVAFNEPLLADTHRVPREDGKGTDLTAEAVFRKLDALASSPFSFFRGTFHLMAADLLQGRVPGAQAAAPEALIVGDLHLENFGIYRGASDALVFDVNDFDDVGFGPADLDVKRLCTSALLATGLPQGARLAAARAAATGWAEHLVKLGGRFPVPARDESKSEGRVLELLRQGGKRTRAELTARAAPGHGTRKFAESAKTAHCAKAWVHTAEKAVAGWITSLRDLKAAEIPDGYEVLDVAYRFKGTGSLGRLRFSALLGKGDARRIVEIKEARPGALDVAAGRPDAPDRARVQTASIRRLQGDPWRRVAGTHLGRLPALGREIEPEEEKLSCEAIGSQELPGYARQCGEVLARLHARASAPQLLAGRWDPAEAARAAVSFAEGYAAQVTADHQAFVKARSDVARKLGLPQAPAA
jgi:uncharacterized protein (DUF2252 family)